MWEVCLHTKAIDFLVDLTSKTFDENYDIKDRKESIKNCRFVSLVMIILLIFVLIILVKEILFFFEIDQFPDS